MTKSQKEEAQKEQQAKKELEEKEEARRKERVSLLSDVSFIVNCIASRSLNDQIRMLDMVNGYFKLTHSSYENYSSSHTLIHYE